MPRTDAGDIVRPPLALLAEHEGRTYALRAPEPRQARALADAVRRSLPELRAFMPWAHAPVTPEQQFARLVVTQADFWSGRDMVFHLFDDGDDLLGSFGLHRRALNPRALEVGYWMRSDASGRGLATFAVRCLVVLCFEHLGCERVQCAHNLANHASRRVNEKVGFRVEGHLRCFEPQPTAEMVADGAVREPTMVMRALLRSDLPDLPWFRDVAARLRLLDWEGRPLPVMHSSGAA